MPKSSSFTNGCPSTSMVTNTFSGLRSRCTMPTACAAESARATAARIGSAASSASGPSARIRASRVLPSSTSIA